MDQQSQPLSVLSTQRLFEGGGETGAILRAMDWARTPLGPVDTWPQTLKTMVRMNSAARPPATAREISTAAWSCSMM
jgi:hypothetical protein